MTLAESLRDLAPPDAARDSADKARRVAALAVVYAALQRLARRVVHDGDLHEDVASEVACSLVCAGPLDPRTLPDTAEGAEAYLVRSLKNRHIDWLRKRSGHRAPASLDDVPEPRQPDVFTPDDLDGPLRRQLLAEATRVLYDRAVPDIARQAPGRFDRDGFTRAIGELRDLARQRTTVDALLVAAHGACTADGRNRLYKQHERARSRLLAELPPWLREAQLAPLLDTAVRNVAVVELAPRVDRRTAP